MLQGRPKPLRQASFLSGLKTFACLKAEAEKILDNRKKEGKTDEDSRQAADLGHNHLRRNTGSNLVNPDMDENDDAQKQALALAKKRAQAAMKAGPSSKRVSLDTSRSVDSNVLFVEDGDTEDENESALNDYVGILKGGKVLRPLKSIKASIAKLPPKGTGGDTERKDLEQRQAAVLSATALQLPKLAAMSWQEIYSSSCALDVVGFPDE